MYFYICLFFLFFLLALVDRSQLHIVNGARLIGKKSFSYKVIFGILMFVGATRSMRVGTDVGYYCDFFRHVTFANISQEHFETGFAVMMIFFKKYLTSNPMFFIYFIFIIYIYCNASFIKRYTVKPSMALFVIYGLTFYFSALNEMRQALCHAVILTLIPLISSGTNQRKFIYFFSLVLVISFLIQKSQIILVLCLIPFIFENKFSRSLLALSIIASFLLGQYFMPTIFGFLGLIALYIGDGRYSDYLIYEGDFGDASVNSLFAHSLYTMVLVYFYRNKGKSKCTLTDQFLIMGVIGNVLSNSLSPISWIFQRLSDGLLYFRIIPIANYFYTIEGKVQRNIFRIITICYILFRFYERLLRDNALGNGGDVIPYVNELLNITFI